MGETIDPKSASARTSRFPPWVAVVVGVFVVAIVGALILIRGGGDDDTATGDSGGSTEVDGSARALLPLGTSSEQASTVPTGEVAAASVPVSTPTATVPPTTVPIAPVDPPTPAQADVSIGGFLDRIPAVINPTIQSGSEPPTSGADALPDLSTVATGAVLGELQATAAEFAAMGWTQQGIPAIVDLRVLQAPSPTSPTDAVVEACLDNTDARIVDETGRDVRPPDTPKRSLNIYVLRLVGDAWLVAQHSFPDDPNC